MSSLFPPKKHGKDICTATCIFLFFSGVCAQNAPDYQFAASSGTYTALSGATTVTVSNADDGYYNGIPMGFNFIFGGVADYTDIHVSTNGWLTLGTSSSNNAISAGNTGSTNNFTVPPLAVPIIAPLWDNNSLTSTTNISYATSGTSPNRVTTVQYSNVKCTFNATSANIQFQVKFYETTNVIRFVYQPLGEAIPPTGRPGCRSV